MRANTSILVLVDLLLCALTSCGEKSDPDNVTAGQTEAVMPPPRLADAVKAAKVATSVARPITGHFAHITAVKDTLLFADLANAQLSLAWLVEKGSSPEDPKSWEPFTANLQEIASLPASEDPILSVAHAVAELAAECGDCHAAHEIDPHILLSKIDSPNEGFKNHMIGHKWALDRMWAGLATPSDALWAEGAALIADKPTHLKNLSNYKAQGGAAIELAQRTHELAASAMHADTQKERIDLFGRFLSTCASCHSLEGSGIGNRSVGITP